MDMLLMRTKPSGKNKAFLYPKLIGRGLRRAVGLLER